MTDTSSSVLITEHNTLDCDTIREIRHLVNVIAQEDGLSPLSEHVLIHLHHGLDPRSTHILGRSQSGALIAYLHLDQTDEVAGAAIEVAVLPAERRHGVGSALVRAAIDLVGNKPIRLWAHGKNAAAHQLAKALHFEQVRELWQMRRSLVAPIPHVSGVDGITIREFIPGFDDAVWVDLNQQIFAHHPEQGTWMLNDLHIRMAEPWFDAHGFFLAVDAEGNAIGYVWTKIHGGHHQGHHEHPEIGEIYVLGVATEHRNRGISTLLTVKALEYLRSRGLPSAMLYVDADNTLAIEIYTKLGFAQWDTDVMFKRAVE